MTTGADVLRRHKTGPCVIPKGALTDNQEQTLTPSEAAAIHAILATWLAEDPPEEATSRARLEKLQRATSPI
jgi:hypothetical protein